MKIESVPLFLVPLYIGIKSCAIRSPLVLYSMSRWRFIVCWVNRIIYHSKYLSTSVDVRRHCSPCCLRIGLINMYSGKYLLLSVKYLVLFPVTMLTCWANLIYFSKYLLNGRDTITLCLRVGQIRFIAVNIYWVDVTLSEWIWNPFLKGELAAVWERI